MKLIGLARVSTDEQAGKKLANTEDDREGLDRQHISLIEVAKAHGCPVRIVDVINVSGSDVADCKEWQNVILPALQDPNAHLAIDEIKRLIRADAFDLRVLQQLKQLGKIIYLKGMKYDTKDPRDVMVLTMFAGLGGYDKAELKRQMQAGKEAKRKRGKWVSRLDSLPTGITYDRKAEVWGYNDKAPMVKAMFQAAAEGQTFTAIAKAHGLTVTNTNKVKGEVEKTINVQCVKAILRNPIYDGRLRFDERRGAQHAKINGKQAQRRKVSRPDDEIIDVRVFPEADQLIPHDLWKSVQHRIRESQTQHRKMREEVSPHTWASTYLFSGQEGLTMEPIGDTGLFWVTDAPNRHIIYGKGTGTGPSKVPRYLCRCTFSNRADHLPKCGLLGFRASNVNAALDRYLLELTTEQWFLDAAKAALAVAEVPDSQADKDRIIKALAALDKRDRKVIDGYEADMYGIAEAKRRQEVIKTERQNLQADLARLQDMPELPSQEALEAQARTWGFDPRWEPDRKRAWLAKYILRIRISNKGIDSALVRIAGDNGSQVTFGSGDERSWASLLGQMPRGLAAQAVAKGAVTTEGAAERLGLTVPRLQALLRDSILPDLAEQVGAKRIWSDDAIAGTQQALEALKAEAGQRVSAGELAKLLGLNREQVRYAETTGKLPKAYRNEQGQRYWLRAEVAGIKRV